MVMRAALYLDMMIQAVDGWRDDNPRQIRILNALAQRLYDQDRDQLQVDTSPVFQVPKYSTNPDDTQ